LKSFLIFSKKVSEKFFEFKSSKNEENAQEIINLLMNILYIFLYHSKENLEKEELQDLVHILLIKENSLLFTLIDVMIQITSNINFQMLPLKKILLMISKCFYLIFGSFNKINDFEIKKEFPKFKKKSEYKLKKEDVSVAFNGFDFDENNKKVTSTLEREDIISKAPKRLKLIEKLQRDFKKELDKQSYGEILYVFFDFPTHAFL
jgi:hypothetical protein